MDPQEFASDIVEAIKGLSPTQKEEIAEGLARYFWTNQRSRAMQDVRNQIAPRILVSGNEINKDASGNPVGFGNTGKSQFPVVNFLGATGSVDSSVNGVQANVQTAGGGADCLFNFLVSSCFATLPGFTEGQSFTTVSGCTYKGYSTVKGAVTQAATDFPSTTPAVIAVCSGTYAETNIQFALNQYVRIMGCGRDAVVIGGSQATTPGVVFDGTTHTGLRLWLTGVTLKTTHGQSTTAGAGLSCSNAAQIWIWDCRLTGNASTGGAHPEYAVAATMATGVLARWVITNTLIDGSYGVSMTGGNGGGLLSDCVFDSCTVAASAGEDTVIDGNQFFSCTTGVSIPLGVSNTGIRSNLFVSCTTCVNTTTTGSDIAITDNSYDTCTTFIDASALTSNYQGWIIQRNNGQLSAASGTFLKLPASWSLVPNWIITDNIADSTANSSAIAAFFTGADSVGITWRNNTMHLTAATTNTPAREPVDGATQRKFTGGIYFINDDIPLTVGVTACTIRFGETDVAVSRQTVVLTASATNYIEINSAGTLSANTSAFSTGTYHVLIVVTGISGGNATYSSHTDVGGILYVSAPTGGGTPASNADPFVTIGNVSDLSAERALTAGNGVGFTDGGANSTVTLNLANLTGNWTQAGVFDISQAGNLTVLKHAGFGGAAVNSNIILNTGETINDPSGTREAIAGTLTLNYTAGGTNTNPAYGLVYTIAPSVAPSVTETVSGILTGAQTFINATAGLAGALTLSDLRNFDARSTIGAGVTATSLQGMHIRNAAGAGTVTTQYGLYIEAMTTGGTNYGIYQLGGQNFLGGEVIEGPVTAPSTPASGNLVTYNESGTQFLKTKDAAGNVYNMTHPMTVEGVVDGSTASTTVPFAVMRVPITGTITGVFAKCAENKTIGATSWIGDVHKILLASADSDGQGTTIYTTQANRPTIANTHMYTAATAPDVTSVAAGDWLAFYTDQAGTNATFLTMVVDIRPT